MRMLIAAFAVLTLSPVQASPLPGLPSDFTDGIEAPSAAELLGFEIGERHPEPHELNAFYRRLAEDSPRVRVESIGRSHGGREQLLLYFSRPERVERIEEIRDQRVSQSRAGEGPPVVWLGYAVHGNEASAASAAAVVAWYLAFGADERVQRWMDELVIVMEPVINPDGVARFAHWVNMHRGRNPSSDPRDREHNEAWPNGRTSYYWFDLNRDWMPLTHPVSRNRIEHYRQWRPHLLTDVHEMGSRSTYFFQPGIPERNNPATPDEVFELTERIAQYHALLLDEAGQLYYSRETFDDYYLGKGSTYPDLTGGIGILFEQGSARGHRMDTPYGLRTFADGIANQVLTSFSTLEASVDLGADLVARQARFFETALEMAGRGGWVLADDGDPQRARRLLKTLLGHGIEIQQVSETTTIDGIDYAPGSAWAIPAAQDQFRFVRALFSTPTELPMETFYDVSAWPLQHAFDLPLSRTNRLPALGDVLTAETLPDALADAPEIDSDSIAWIIAWDQHHAPALLAELLDRGYRVQAAERPLSFRVGGDQREFGRGTLIIHSGIQPDDLPPVADALTDNSARFRVRVHSLDTGLASSGIDLGSPSAPVLEAPRPVLLTGSGVSANGAGYVWRWFDEILDHPLTRIDADDLPSDLRDYTHLILPPGRYARLGDRFAEKLVSFVRDGGQIIALGRSAAWVESLDLDWSFGDDDDKEEEGDSEDAESTDESEQESARYADFRLDSARRIIGGSVLGVELDVTHPLGYGYTATRLSTFRRGAHVLQLSNNRYATPGRYLETPLVAGYLSDWSAERLAGTPAIAADRIGRGLVTRIADDPLFRGYWAGGERLLANALFFGQLVDRTRLPK